MQTKNACRLFTTTDKNTILGKDHRGFVKLRVACQQHFGKKTRNLSELCFVLSAWELCLAFVLCFYSKRPVVLLQFAQSNLAAKTVTGSVAWHGK